MWDAVSESPYQKPPSWALIWWVCPHRHRNSKKKKINSLFKAHTKIVFSIQRHNSVFRKIKNQFFSFTVKRVKIFPQFQKGLGVLCSQQCMPILKKDHEKMKLFLINLWRKTNNSKPKLNSKVINCTTYNLLSSKREFMEVLIRGTSLVCWNPNCKSLLLPVGGSKAHGIAQDLPLEDGWDSPKMPIQPPPSTAGSHRPKRKSKY